MFIKGQLIDSKIINVRLLSSPAYIYGLKMELEEEHEEIIDLSNEEPEFYIDHIPSSMNRKRFFEN
jgi:hypothetical protein